MCIFLLTRGPKGLEGVIKQRGTVPPTKGKIEMTKKITAAEFEALKANAASIEDERDVEYSYETLIDAEGNEIAFASYSSNREPDFTLFAA